MDIEEEVLLFGAPPGRCKGITLAVTEYPNGFHGVQMYCHPVNRQQLLTLHVTCSAEQGIGTVIGAFVPLLNRSSNLTVNFARRSLWAIHNRLGAMGYEVAIRNCGREPKH